MKLDKRKVGEQIRSWLMRIRKRLLRTEQVKIDVNEAPFRAELYSSVQLDRHGKLIAASHKLLPNKVSDKLLKRLDSNEEKLLAVRNLLVENIRLARPISPAGDWLLDNFYLIEEQVILAREHLPKGYSEGLPHLSEMANNMPRVYDITIEIIDHSDGRVDANNLSSFIKSYQSETILKLGELWAVPIMLRLAVIENLRRLSDRMAADIIDHNIAEYWADKFIAQVESNPGDLILVIADMVRSVPTLNSSFVASFTRKLQGRGNKLSLPLSWMEEQLAAQGFKASELISRENQTQASDQVSIRNSITTLRFINTHDWPEFVEAHSSVEQVLRSESAGVYPLMDFTTRDRYRHVVEAVSKAGSISETKVAKEVVALSYIAIQSANIDLKAHHIGYFLLGDGLKDLKASCNVSLSFFQKMREYMKHTYVGLYITSILLVSASLTACLTYIAFYIWFTELTLIIPFVISTLAVTCQLSSALINWIATLLVTPQLLPRMDYSKGIPEENSTMVTIPTMIRDKAYIDDMVEALEIRFLSNSKSNIYYSLLTDFTDAQQEEMPEDAALMAYAKERINALNEKYNQSGNDIFFLFHRARTWNKSEGKWMGFERKRGKLSALNVLLKTRNTDAFATIAGRLNTLKPIRYVITLDSDTQLPMNAAWKLIATIAHPLNKAVYCSRLKRITEGHAILQPRVAVALSKRGTSLYARMIGNQKGIDPYTRASSDVYQDLFGEGSFIGKGIYEIDLFEKAVKGKFQDNRILSHDLLEGCYARCGLVSDVMLYEDEPIRYQDDIKRHHRWIRGDWQVGAWALPFVTRQNKHIGINRLSLLSRWKIMDNLRRSLLPFFLILLLIMGWTALPYAWFWTLMVTLILTIPDMAGASWQLLHKPIDVKLNVHLHETGVSMLDVIIRFVFRLTVLPFEALIYLDAIILTNWRLIFSKRKLLQWTPSGSSVIKAKDPLSDEVWVSPLFAIGCFFLLIQFQAANLYIAMPFLILWTLSPVIIKWMSATTKDKQANLTGEQYIYLHKTARKTWSFFETFVTANDHWLPPDNYQESPVIALARRTSPTNMGLTLLANLTAYDFGYIPVSELMQRSMDTLKTMAKLERYNGHFYNWYDTDTILPLAPKYVSTVDSGNLIGHLLVLKQGILNLSHQPVFNPGFFEGVTTTVQIIQDCVKTSYPALSEKIYAFSGLQIDKDALYNIKIQLHALLSLVSSLSDELTGEDTTCHKWISRLRHQVESALLDLQYSIPWLDFLPVPHEFPELECLNHIPFISSIPAAINTHLQRVGTIERQALNKEDLQWIDNIKTALDLGLVRANEFSKQRKKIAALCEELSTVSYDFLHEQSTGLLRIGYNVDEQHKDESYYDLLASEARLGIFVAIAQGKLPQESWFALGRLLTATGKKTILLSWSGSMFEYLMPQLVMPAFENTLLYQTNKAMVDKQIAYAEQMDIPWGISESAYNAFDVALNYQYRAFGVPGIGLKRSLEEDIVIAPYATAMALMIAPEKACVNLQRLSNNGFEGEYGFYEAIDYTPARLPAGKKFEVIKTFMVHHQGMAFLSLSYLLNNMPMQKRFTSELRFQASLLLLQERIPRARIFHPHTAAFAEQETLLREQAESRVATANTPLPEIQLLSNGTYHVMATNSGGGYSRWKGLAITRWREDSVTDDLGIFAYVKDLDSSLFWSNVFQPTLKVPGDYEVAFSQGHIEYKRTDNGIEVNTKIIVSPEDDVELRRMRITNKGKTIRHLEITSYTEVVLASQASDEAHPAFSKMFVQTEIYPDHKGIICTRRPRSQEELPPWMFHHMNIQDATVEAESFETDRMKFIGRGRHASDPAAMYTGELSGTDGAVLDPILAIRQSIKLKPGQTATIDMIYGVAATKESCNNLLYKYRDPNLRKRATELSWTHNQVLMKQLNATEIDVQLYDRLASSVIFINPLLRADVKTIQSNRRGQPGLWSHSVSGDLPIVLLHVYEAGSLDIARQLIQAHAYWRLKGVAVDLVIWNEEYGSYRQQLHEQISAFVNAEFSGNTANDNLGNIYVKSYDQVSIEDRILFESIARVVLYNNKGTLSEQMETRLIQQNLPARLKPVMVTDELGTEEVLSLPNDLLFYNGSGGFSAEGNEYLIKTDRHKPTPAPWVNVIANPDFGTVISESGSSYTWASNAHEYRLSPWNNDPVGDTSGEAFYIRDEVSGHFWSPAAFPVKSSTPYITTHGFGYSIIKHREQGICSEMTVFVDVALPVKFISIKLKNNTRTKRKLSATGFIEMVLGESRSKTGMHLLPAIDDTTGTLLFRNHYNSAFADRLSFFRVLDKASSFTTSRNEFIGRNKNLQNPEALNREHLSGRISAGKDICAAIQIKVELLPDETRELIFLLGSCKDEREAFSCIEKFKESEAVLSSLAEVKNFWIKELSQTIIKTPDNAIDMMTNGWLLYQNMSCRLFARTGFYQSGGAFGFRDQLQDVLALLHNKPGLARNQIILHAGRQFTEGDVQHWWHPPEGRGVRTRCSDDLLWLPYAVSKYLMVTGDKAILSVTAGFLNGHHLQQGEDTLYELPQVSNDSANIYEHCVRSIKKSLISGMHGLPLIGSGDWNDGMDKVGNLGKGESVWLAFFLYEILMKFQNIANEFDDIPFSELCYQHALILKKKIKQYAWDGAWYLRGWFDDGTPLGSRQNDEASIDSIAQSWSVLSGGGEPQRCIQAMTALYNKLVRKDLKIIQLLNPAFDISTMNPGYIKGYVPGIRENGGQYSHAAIWAIMAFAKIGKRDRVYELIQMILPINRSQEAASKDIYKVEPYVMAADIYANKSHEGRGGWTWYTGSAGWMYQLLTDVFIGLERNGDTLTFNPCFPLSWPSVEVQYRFRDSLYLIIIYQKEHATTSSWQVDDDHGAGNSILLKDDSSQHTVIVWVATGN